MAKEKEKKSWVNWLPFAILALNSLIRVPTGISAYEYTFGKKMNLLKDYREYMDQLGSNKEINEKSLELRTREIRRLVEETRPKALERNIQKQEQQKKNQDKGKIILKEMLPIGSKVYVKLMGLKKKLDERYNGPYEIIGHTELGNYILQDSLKNKLGDTFPITRLKPVSEAKNDEPVYEVEKILEHKKNGDDYLYLVKWRNFGKKHNSWEPKESFLDVRIIRKYWEKVEKEKTASAKGKTTVKPKAVESNPTRKNPPRKAKIPYIAIIALFFLIIPLVATTSGAYYYNRMIDALKSDNEAWNRAQKSH